MDKNKDNGLQNMEITEEIYTQISLFLRKLRVIFCYYNELGDEFSFLNSDNEEVIIIMKKKVILLFLLIFL